MHAPDAADERAAVFAQHFVLVQVAGIGGLHGGADEAFRAGEVQAGAHLRGFEALAQRFHQGVVARVDLELDVGDVADRRQVVLAGEAFGGIEHGDRRTARHFVEQAEHGAAAAALAGDDVVLAAFEWPQVVVDRTTLDTCDEHSCCTSKLPGAHRGTPSA
ncbi:hypothetical protein D3C78_1178800 [compost metagenome]